MGHTVRMRDWLVAGGLLRGSDGVLLVQNERRNGSLDWSTPGGVIDEGETLLQGLTREVHEETGLVVAGWDALAYEVEVDFICESTKENGQYQVDETIAFEEFRRVVEEQGLRRQGLIKIS